MKPKINRFILKKGCFNMDLLNENHAQEQKPIKGKKNSINFIDTLNSFCYFNNCRNDIYKCQ